MLLLSLCIAAAACIGYLDWRIPSAVTANGKEAALCQITNDFVSFSYNTEETTPGSAVSHYSGRATLLGMVPLKEVSVNVVQLKKVYPGGMNFGIRLNTDGVLVVGMSSVTSESKSVSPAYDAGLRAGDIITAINGQAVTTAEQVTSLFCASGGASMQITAVRGKETKEFSLKCARSDDDGRYKAGVWIRDSTAGIGTVTFVTEDGLFAGLGHGICDSDTGVLLPLRSGTVTGVTVSGINKGQPGCPGELKGYLSGDVCGELIANTKCGLYGRYSQMPTAYGDALPIGLKDEIRNGDATILSAVSGELRSYTVRISDCGRGGDSDCKNFIVTVTDPDLIAQTGGIVQGMSGSPIIQNGKLVGAVTHVLVNDPKKGYGIFIENMLNGLQNVSK